MAGKRATFVPGTRYGRLTLIERAGSDKYRHPLVRCQCDCGKETIAVLSQVRSTDPKQWTHSSGCLRDENYLGYWASGASVESGIIENRLKQELRSLLPSDVGLFCESKVRLEYGSPAELIPVVAESESASLIVVGLRNQSGLADHSPWSTLSHVIREAKCGVLGVRGHLL
jgi:hypothetical protein